MAEEGSSRRSNAITLTVLGVVGAVWIADEVIPEGVEMRRNTYADRAACERDYPASQCAPQSSGGGSVYFGSYYGPYYSANRIGATPSDPGPGRSGGIARASYTTSYRGGFCSFGHAIHAVS
jgi:hypothetical protein